MGDNKLVTFDSESRVRVLDADKHAASVTLQESCAEFDTKVDQLQDSARKYIGMLENVAGHIEAEKLRAVGLRNRVGALSEAHKATSAELEQRKREQQRQLKALTQEEKSLQLVLEEQEAQIARLKGQAAA